MVDRKDLIFDNYINKGKTDKKDIAKTRKHKEGRTIKDYSEAVIDLR